MSDQQPSDLEQMAAITGVDIGALTGRGTVDDSLIDDLAESDEILVDSDTPKAEEATRMLGTSALAFADLSDKTLEKILSIEILDEYERTKSVANILAPIRTIQDTVLVIGLCRAIMPEIGKELDDSEKQIEMLALIDATRTNAGTGNLEKINKAVRFGLQQAPERTPYEKLMIIAESMEDPTLGQKQRAILDVIDRCLANQELKTAEFIFEEMPKLNMSTQTAHAFRQSIKRRTTKLERSGDWE